MNIDLLSDEITMEVVNAVCSGAWGICEGRQRRVLLNEAMIEFNFWGIRGTNGREEA